jgi:hypothetical protein
MNSFTSSPANFNNLNVAGSTALETAGGVLIQADGSGPNAVLTLPVNGLASLGDGKSIKVDTSAPTLMGGMPFPNSVGVARDSNFVLGFNESVNLVNTKIIAFKRLDNDATGRIATISNAGASGEVTLTNSNKSITINPARNLDGPTKAIATKSLTSNVATLTTTADHGFATGATIVVSGVDATFNGRFTLLSASGSTLTYAKIAADVATGPVDFGGAIGTYLNVSNKALTSNVATLTTSVVHGFAVGDLVAVGGIDATFNGIVSVASVPTTTTFTYAKATTDVPSAAVSGGYAAPQVPTQYYLQIPNDAIRDAAGNLYAGYLDRTYVFTTGVDTVKPALFSSDPPSGMTTFSVRNNAGNGPRSISMVFTEGISAGTGNITLAQTGGSSTTFAVSSDVTISSTTATFTPASLLAENAAFTVSVPCLLYASDAADEQCMV